MASGMNYTDNVILTDYPCDIESIVRYKGGFNLCEKALTFVKWQLPAFTPMWVNLTTRETFPLLDSLGTSTIDTFNPPSVVTNTNEIAYGFLYSDIVVQKGVSVSIIMKANEINYTILHSLRAIDEYESKTEIGPYIYLLTSSNARTTLKTKYPLSTFIWA